MTMPPQTPINVSTANLSALGTKDPFGKRNLFLPPIAAAESHGRAGDLPIAQES
jgi:hypothetical protein